MKQFTLIYEPDNNELEKVADGFAYEYIIKLINDTKNGVNVVLYTCQEFVLDNFRLAVRRGLINNKDVEIKFNDETILVDPNGHLSNWPKGMDKIQELYMELAW